MSSTPKQPPLRARPLEAHRNEPFLVSPVGRPLRILAEYLEPLSRLEQQSIEDTIVFFGSSRIGPPEAVRAELEEWKKTKAKGPRARASRRELRRRLQLSRYYTEARELARLLTAWAMRFGSSPNRFVICSGGGPGIMEAANRGAQDAGGRTIGLSITLPDEISPNPYIPHDLSFLFHYFFMRKLWFAQIAKALIIFPGGYGTLDELAEMLTLMQTKKLDQYVPILMYGTRYWKKVLRFDLMQRWGTINEADTRWVRFADTPRAAFRIIRGELERHHLKTPGLSAMLPGSS